MKYLLLLVLPLLLGNEPEKPAVKESVKQAAENPIDSETCSCKGKRLWGKVEVVNSGADFKVEIVNSFSDIKVEVVSAFPSRCGQWEFVSSGADFKIEFVNSGADFKIEFVQSFAGIPGNY